MSELEKENAKLKAENAELRAENQDLRERQEATEALLKKVMEQVNQNSSNSSYPPSRDKGRTKNRSERKKSERPIGGQKGHKGYTLEMNPTPDKVEIHRPSQCRHCRQKLSQDAETLNTSKRQVLDLPPLTFITTEHQRHDLLCCHCGEVTKGEFPADVTHQVQYGKGVKQLAVYLRTEQFIPYKRKQQLLSDLFGLPVAVGSLQNFISNAAKRVEPLVEEIKSAIVKIGVAHADETGFYINGKRQWLHTFSTNRLSYYAPHQSRGRKATDSINLLPQYKGVLVHDSLPLYHSYKEFTHSLCNAHHLRELTAVVENDEQLWAKLMHQFLRSAKRMVSLASDDDKTALPDVQLQRISQLFDLIVEHGLQENPLPDTPPPKGKRGRPKKTKARNLVERFQKRKDEILRFVYDFDVPFDNNLAERDIRMMKVQQKISGCFRSQAGAENFCALRSYTASLRKQQISSWRAIGSLFHSLPISPIPTPV